MKTKHNQEHNLEFEAFWNANPFLSWNKAVKKFGKTPFKKCDITDPEQVKKIELVKSSFASKVWKERA